MFCFQTMTITFKHSSNLSHSLNLFKKKKSLSPLSFPALTLVRLYPFPPPHRPVMETSEFVTSELCLLSILIWLELWWSGSWISLHWSHRAGANSWVNKVNKTLLHLWEIHKSAMSLPLIQPTEETYLMKGDLQGCTHSMSSEDMSIVACY